MEHRDKETYWSQYVETYEEKQQYVVGEAVVSMARKALLEEQNLGSVLELGCGTGLYTETLQQNAGHIVATDLSDEMIAYARQKRGAMKNVEFKKANALDLEFASGSFDTVFMANLIHIVGNAERVIQESHRVLKKNGLLIITSFALQDMDFISRIVIGVRFLKTFGKPSTEATKEKTTRKSIENLLLKNGFDISKSLLLGEKSKAIYITGIKS